MNATEYDPDTLDLPSGCFIGGNLLPGEGVEYDVLRPSDGRVARRERGASREQVDQAVEMAARAFKTSGWSAMAPRARAAVMKRWADLVDNASERLARVESIVGTRIVGEARIRDVKMTAEVIRYYAELIDKVDGKVLPTGPDVLSLLISEPHGVVAAIAPWNVPLLLATNKLAPALAAGNAIVLKPSELTPYSAIVLAQLAIEAGLPPGQISIVPGLGIETGEALVRHPRVNYVSFTGSTATGARVMSEAALYGLKPVSLELGGKSPQLVFADAVNLDSVAELVAAGVCRNAGQVCFAGTRLVIEKRIANEMVEKIGKLIDRVVPGPTWGTATTLAPIVSERQCLRIEDILTRATASGAEIMSGGQRFPTNEGAYFQPTIVLGAEPDNPVIREEVFGPVLAVQPFEDIEEGLVLADHPLYGLAGAVHTSDINKAVRAARSIQAGTVWVNHYGPTPDVTAPMGGYKQSGFGKDFGIAGLEKYQKTKNVWIKLH